MIWKCSVKVDEKSNEITAIPRLLELSVLNDLRRNGLPKGDSRKNDRERSALYSGLEEQSEQPAGTGCGFFPFFFALFHRMSRRMQGMVGWKRAVVRL
jgi:hypothetical protein